MLNARKRNKRSRDWMTAMAASVALLVTVVVLGGCTPGSESVDGDGSYRAIDGPRLVTDTEELVFVAVVNGGEDQQTVTLRNAGATPLRLDRIELVEETLDDRGGSEFHAAGDWPETATLGPDDVLTLSVDYRPTDDAPDAGYVEIHSNDPAHEGVHEIAISTQEVAPRLFTPDRITFQRVPRVTAATHDAFWKITDVQNVGLAELQIDDIAIAPQDSGFELSFPDSAEDENPADDATDPPRTLKPDESFPLRVLFNPVDDLPAQAELVFFTNDPAEPEYRVALSGNAGSPCIALSEEDTLDFGQGGLAVATHETVVIENCSATSDLEVTDIRICTDTPEAGCADSDVFQIRPGSLPEGIPGRAVLGPKETANFVLTYTPTEIETSTGALTVFSNDPARPEVEVPLIGEATDNACPTAVAEAKLQEAATWGTDRISTIPLKTIDLRATNSTDSDGTIERYEWTIVQRPTSSTTTLLPSPNVADPTLFLDLAGDYLVELKVWDEDGTKNCGQQATIAIRATPNEDIHVQLVWDTPSDADQTDDDGTDVDLHFLHPNGNWNERPWDIYWNNPEANWGEQIDMADDPSLDIDDTNGAGPENINLDHPETNVRYSVGAYYYSESGYGPSYATIRIYLNGVQTQEFRDVQLNNRGDFWHAADIAWPSGEIFAVGQVTSDFPNRL